MLTNPETRRRRSGQGKKPASPEGEARSMTLRVRLTPAEYIRVMQAAQHNWQGWTATDWIRNTLLNAAVDQEQILYEQMQKIAPIE